MNFRLHIPAFIILILIFAACEGTYLSFENPQPPTGKKLSRIKKNHTGLYRQFKSSNSQNVLPYTSLETLYEVKPKHIYRFSKFKHRYLLSDSSMKEGHNFYFKLDSLSRVAPDSLWGYVATLHTTTDTAEVCITRTDTIFYKSEKYVLKSYGDKYYCNALIEKNAWNSMQLTFLNSLLIVRTTSEDDTAFFAKSPSFRKRSAYMDSAKKEGLAEGLATVLVGSFMDQYKYAIIVNPSQKEFEEFVRQGGFKKREEYLKIKQEDFEN